MLKSKLIVNKMVAPELILWDNLGVTTWNRFSRQIIVFAFTIMILLATSIALFFCIQTKN
jgi:hypothetical protein